MIELDGTDNKARLGANALLGASLAAAHAAAQEKNLPLYRSLSGKRPYRLAGADDEHHQRRRARRQQRRPAGVHGHAGRRALFAEALRWAPKFFMPSRSVLNRRGYNTAVGDEGGFAPDLPNNASAIDLILEAAEKAGYKPGKEIAIALDSAASEFYNGTAMYRLEVEGRTEFPADRMIRFYVRLVRQVPDLPSRTAWRRTTGTAGRS